MANNGKQGERLFADTMRRRNYTVVDTTANPDYWYKDIDFIVTSSTTGLTKSFEVKWDQRINSTGNLFLEVTNIHSKEGKGWWQFCQADYLAYGDAKTKVFYIIPVEELRKRLELLTLQRVNCGGDSTGLLLPLTAIKDITQIL